MNATSSQDFKDAHLARLKRQIAQFSISALNASVQEMA